MASDMTLYGNPLNRALASTYSQRLKQDQAKETDAVVKNFTDKDGGENVTTNWKGIPHEAFPSTSLHKDPDDICDIIAADMIRYDNPLNCLDRLAIGEKATHKTLGNNKSADTGAERQAKQIQNISTAKSFSNTQPIRRDKAQPQEYK